MVIVETLKGERKSSIPIEDRTDSLNHDSLRTNKPEAIIIHSTRSYSTFQDLLRFHKQRGFAGAGYHFFMAGDNRIYQARPIFTEGAHALGSNTSSIGLSLYAPDGKLSAKKEELGRGLIGELQKSYGNLRVIPHTLAQIEYINQVLRANGIDKSFDAGADIVEPQKYERIAKEIERFIGTLGTDRHFQAKNLLKALKNCPGPLFKQLI